ncbi:glycoside hydrolase family 35 protein [Panus rudis PR-1116 ss-1]|nr:glycoside hydrolase family 35 protein [Panus rudis PR-1116 ss-1]
MLPCRLLSLLTVLGGVLFAQFTSSLLASATFVSSLVKRNSTGLTDLVTWDSHSLFIQGQRVFILSAEFHPWRLPNPELWSDIFQKIRANGFNTVSFYVNWAVHYPTPGTNAGAGDFEEGTYRDIQRFIDEAQKAGLWLIARPGPYINAETTGGGFPGWVGNIAGSLRTDNSNYTEAWTPYMTGISKIIAKNQITNGGPIILVQAENEFSVGSNRSPYMQQIIDLYRANGVVVPITHNDQHAGQAGNYSPDLPGEGRVNIYCGDSYPQGSNRWAQVQAVYYSNHVAVAPNNPLCLAEFGGGFLLGWGSVAQRGGTGYEKYSNDLTNATFENVFYKDTYSQTATILSIYMLFGGTNWGQTLEPTVYSSYDYGGGINENRVATSKMNEMRLQGLFLRVSRDLLGATLIANGTNYTSSSAVHTAELRNLETGTAFYFVRHDDSTSLARTQTQLNVTTSAGQLAIPKNESLVLDGRESKILVTDYVFGASKAKIIYSTAEILTWTTIDNRDFILLYAPSGQFGETVLSLPSAPKVDLSHAPGVSSSVSSNTVTLSNTFTPGSSAYASITAGKQAIEVVTLDKSTALKWHAVDIPGKGKFGGHFSVVTNQSVLVSGPYLIRSASISGNTLSLTGDLNGSTAIEIFAPASVSKVTWNGRQQRVSKTARKSLAFTAGSVPQNVKLPALTKWKAISSLPEIDPSFDDSHWITANLTATNYTNLPPLTGDHVLYSQQYGFYGGNLLFRGHFNASGSETSIQLTVQGGVAFGYSAFLNGVFLGSVQGNSTASQSTDEWNVPASTLKVGDDNVLVVIQDHMGIVETSTNGGKEPRGLRGYAILNGNSTTNPTTFSHWKIQGNLGGAANAPDTWRGYLNEGGLYAERIGAHLPGYLDSHWTSASPVVDGVKGAGVNFFRTTFDLDLPADMDVPIRLSLTPADISSNYRVQIYLNGWQLGKYINNIGPQTIYVLPPGILRRQGQNTLALSLWSLDASGAKIPAVSLIAQDGVYQSSLATEGSLNDFGVSQKLFGYAGQKDKRIGEETSVSIEPL